MTSIKIDLSKAKTTQEAVNTVLAAQLKLEKIVAAFNHTGAEPNHRYTIGYMVGDIGTVVAVRGSNLCVEAMELGKRLAAAGVLELAHDNPYAEITSATLDYMIEEKMQGDQLVIKGSNIRYKQQSSKVRQSLPWLTLSDNVKIVVTRLELTDEDYAEFRERQMKEALDAVAKLGYSVDDAGTLVVV